MDLFYAIAAGSVPYVVGFIIGTAFGAKVVARKK